MSKLNKQIIQISNTICQNIETFGVSDRGILSQNILSQLRNLVEHIALKIYCNGVEIPNDYENLKEGIKFIKTRGDLKFLYKFHKQLQISASHYTFDGENSERLMLKYHIDLVRIKTFMIETFKINILDNLNSFPLKQDPILHEYYEKISKIINQSSKHRPKVEYNDRFYIQKVKPFVVSNEIFYEVTITRASDFVSKFDRIIAFTKFDIIPNYAVKLKLSNDFIKIFNKNMPIQIIDSWEISIRPCEIDNFSKIFGITSKSGNTKGVQG
ncbi:MAG: hypothetical protein ACEPOW_14085 [Bacteroidales bacterium]